MLRRSASVPNAPLEVPRLIPPPDLAALVEAALGRRVADDDRLAVAVSGGPDSLALLWLAAQAFPGRVVALTVDHGLRTEAALEAESVAARCALLGMPHATLHWVGIKPGGNIQAAARAARYALMADWCAAHGVPFLLTAHHADDQAETLLMRLLRGSGSGGLAGIRAARPLLPGVMLARPLLGTRRSALAAVVASAGWAAVDDPANYDPRYDRTAVRALLAAMPGLDVPRLAAAAAHLADAEAALAWAADRAWAGATTVDAEAITADVGGLPDELARRLLRRAIATLAPAATPSGPAVATLQRRLAAGGTGTLAGVMARGGTIWHFTRAAPRRKLL